MRTQRIALLRALWVTSLAGTGSACSNPLITAIYNVTVTNVGDGKGQVVTSASSVVYTGGVGTGVCVFHQAGPCTELSFYEAGGGGSYTLTATPEAGYHFSGWGGDCASAAHSNSCTISFLAGSAGRGNAVDVIFERPFSAPATASVSAVQGVPASTTIQVPRAPGFTQPIALAVSPLSSSGLLTSGASVVLSPVTSTTTLDTWTVTISAGSFTSPGQHTVNLTLNGGGFSTSTFVEVAVIAAPPTGDFSLTAPATVTLGAGNITTVPVTIVRSGTVGSVVLSNVSGLPPGVVASWLPQTVPANATTTTLTIDATNAPLLAATATTTLQLEGTVTGLPPRSTALGLTVTPASQTLVPAAGSVTLVPGVTQTKTIAVGRSTAIIGAVSLTQMFSSLTPIVATGSVVASTSTSGSVTLLAPPGTPAGAYSVIISGTAFGGSLGATTTIAVTVNVPVVSGQLVANPAVVVLEPGLPGGSGPIGSSSAIWLGHSGPEALTLSVTVQPAAPGLTVIFSQPSMTGPVAAAVIRATPGTPPGTYTVTITGQGAAVTRTTSIAVTVRYVTEFSFGLTNPVQWTLNTSASYTGFNSVGLLFNSGVTLSVPDLPSGVTTVFTPPTVFPGQVAFLYVFSGLSTPPGLHIFTLTGTSGAITHGQRVLAIVAGQNSIPGKVGIIPPGALTMLVSSVGGAVLTTDVVIARTLNTALTPLTLSVTGLPNGLQASFSANPVQGSAVAMTLSAASTVASGTYTLDVVATGGGPNVQSQVLLTVVRF